MRKICHGEPQNLADWPVEFGRIWHGKLWSPVFTVCRHLCILWSSFVHCLQSYCGATGCWVWLSIGTPNSHQVQITCDGWRLGPGMLDWWHNSWTLDIGLNDQKVVWLLVGVVWAGKELARDVQAKLALIVAHIYLSVQCPSVCLCVCPQQLVTRMYAALRVASHLDYRLVSVIT